MLDRIYSFSADGTATGHDSVVAGDAARTFFYDGANRLTCAATPNGLGACPTSGASLIESYGYSASDGLLSRVGPAGTTTFAYLPGGSALYDEYPPSRTIYYSSPNGNLGGNRTYDQEMTAGSPSNSRIYVYDPQGRLRIVYVHRPTVTASTTRQQHTISMLYDHRSRLIYVSDLNAATSVDARTQYFYDLEDRLINRIIVPNAAAPSTYSVDSYIPIEPLLLGNIHTEYPGATETLLYHALSPEGVPQAGWSFNRTTYATAEAWRAQYTAFGSRTSPTPTSPTLPSLRPPHRFVGQFEIAGSEAAWWNGTTYVVSRGELMLNRWRVYDTRVGSYLQSDPFAIDGQSVRDGAYAYVGAGPLDRSDPTGQIPGALPAPPPAIPWSWGWLLDVPYPSLPLPMCFLPDFATYDLDAPVDVPEDSRCRFVGEHHEATVIVCGYRCIAADGSEQAIRIR